ncbi:hypothetical protein [Halopiger djelfimassiliensis]|uniref:hypothetical protein n=1 Tax=Halopiger djelfimassiliensis TaxID=1293047 RepID=UPI000677D0A7|nr:hypothetical protein [Halopiger djelfimassiliensis]
MTPLVVLVVFCATMAVIALGRLVVTDERDAIDIGTALIVVGITLFTVLWVALVESWLSAITRGLVAVTGTVACCGGTAMLVRYWNVPSCDVRRDDVDGDDTHP